MSKRARVIVVGNEKGGTGKSTVAMHLVVSLLKMGALPMSEHVAVPPTDDPAADEARFLEALERMAAAHEVVLIDTPGSNHPLSRLGHSYADLLVTPLNDSFIDLDVLGKVDSETMKVSRPSHYSEMVWETRKLRAMRGEKAMVDWFVMRNRLSTLDARNKREMERLLAELSKRIGFRPVGGLCERVIYRELFLEGLTLLDMGEGSGVEMSLSHVAARQELRRLVEALGLAQLVGAPA
jgi:chromosome partitioning protein